MKSPRLGWGIPIGDSFVANVGGKIVAFFNRCPHMGSRFCYAEELVSLNGAHLRCPLHGALFESGGLCVKGPCRGERLIANERLLEDLLTDPEFRYGRVHEA